MRRVIAVLSACLALMSIPSISEAQLNLRVGIGLAQPLVGGGTITGATISDRGIVRATGRIDTSPQLAVTLHRRWAFLDTDYGWGPALVVLPRFNTTAASNSDKAQPISGGMGLIFGIPITDTRHLGLLVAWVVSPPVDRLDDAWRPGFQAPIDASGDFSPPAFNSSSPNKLVIGGVIEL